MRPVKKVGSVTWVGNSKTRVMCRFFYEDETTEVMSIPVDESNEYWQEVLKHFTIQEITDFTNESKKVAEEDALARRQRDREATEVKKASALFNAKLEAFDIPEVLTAPKEIKARIRKATSAMQVSGLVAICYVKAMEQQSEQSST